MTENRKPLLKVQDLSVNYGAIKALRSVSLEVYSGEIVCVIGANGAGKSTLMNGIMGMVTRASGEVLLDDIPLSAKSFQVVAQGVALSPEGRKVFAPLTVHENLMMGAFPRPDRHKLEEDLEWVFHLFPRLKERRGQYAGTLSGGEQQMLAIARGLMSMPKLLLVDEMSLGLMPSLVEKVMAAVLDIRKAGITVLLVEQMVQEALEIADRGYVLQSGRVVLSGAAAELLENPEVRRAYLGL